MASIFHIHNPGMCLWRPKVHMSVNNLHSLSLGHALFTKSIKKEWHKSLLIIKQPCPSKFQSPTHSHTYRSFYKMVPLFFIALLLFGTKTSQAFDNGILLQLWTCKNSDGQKWIYRFWY